MMPTVWGSAPFASLCHLHHVARIASLFHSLDHLALLWGPGAGVLRLVRSGSRTFLRGVERQTYNTQEGRDAGSTGLHGIIMNWRHELVKGLGLVCLVATSRLGVWGDARSGWCIVGDCPLPSIFQNERRDASAVLGGNDAPE